MCLCGSARHPPPIAPLPSQRACVRALVSACTIARACSGELGASPPTPTRVRAACTRVPVRPHASGRTVHAPPAPKRARALVLGTGGGEGGGGADKRICSRWGRRMRWGGLGILGSPPPHFHQRARACALGLAAWVGLRTCLRARARSCAPPLHAYTSMFGWFFSIVSHQFGNPEPPCQCE